LKKKEKRIIIGDEEIVNIREKCNANLEGQVCQPISQAIEHLKSFAFNNALIPDVPAITISVNTFHTLIEPISGDSNEVYQIRGKEAGKIFAKKYLDFLRFEVGVPESISHLLKGWAFFDTGANWGTFNTIFDENKKQIFVTLENNFLNRNLEKDKHRFCSFIEGYLYGIFVTCLKYYPRWYKNVISSNPPDMNFFPLSVKEEPEGDICKFIVSLKYEKLVDSFDKIYYIEKLIENGDLRRIPLEIRIVLENALKAKLDINYEERIYVPQLLVPFKESKEKRKLNIKKILNVYAWTSKDAHLTTEYAKEEVIKNLDIVSDFIQELEIIEINEENTKILQNKALDARVGSEKKERGIFISYSHKDKEFVDILVQDLQNSGIPIWIDKREIKLGDSLLDRISDGIEKMEYLAVVLSPNSANSSWVKKELGEAMNEEINGKKIKVLPLLYRDCELPNYLKDKYYADFTDKDRYEMALEMIINRLRE